MTRPGGMRSGFTLVELGIVTAMIGILGAILFPVFANARKAAVKSDCSSHLYQIGLALQLYARDHDARLPPRHNDLGPLVPGYVADLSLFECGTDPAAPRIHQANTGRALADRLYSSYQYRGGLANDDPPDTPLAADWTLRHEGNAHLLRLNGSVKMIRAGNMPPVSMGPPVMPPGVAAPPPEQHTPYLNTPAGKSASSPTPPASGE